MAIIQPSSQPSSTQKKQIERKYGMFIHFGVNTFNNLEWSDGSLPIASFNPTEVDADSWIKNAKDAGMNYVIIITKHHDGFCLFDTQYTDYCVKNSPYKRDVIAQVAAACKKYGIGLGMYYSLWDRHEKCYKNHKEYLDFMCNQLTELLGGRYGEVCELWLDGDWDKKGKYWDIPKLYELVHRLQPDCAVGVNHTIGKPPILGIFKRTVHPENYKNGMPMRYFPADFRLDDPYFTCKGKDADPKLYSHDGKLYYLPFEATICIRQNGHWFWSDTYTQDSPTCAPEYIAERYNQMVEQNNLLVVNVPPNKNGKQEPSDIEPLIKARALLKI